MNKRRIDPVQTCGSTRVNADPERPIYPDTKLGSTHSRSTPNEFLTCSFPTSQSGDKAARSRCHRIPYAHARWRLLQPIRNPRLDRTGTYIGTSMRHIQRRKRVSLNNRDLDPVDHRARRNPFSVGVSPVLINRTAPKNSASTWAHQRPSYARPKRPTSSCAHPSRERHPARATDKELGSQGEPVTGIDHGLNDRENSLTKYIKFFFLEPPCTVLQGQPS